jgi:hypothetical protein
MKEIKEYRNKPKNICSTDFWQCLQDDTKRKDSSSSTNFVGARCWLLTPVILHTEGGRNQEDHSLKPAQANSLWDPILKKIHHKNKTGGVAQGEGPEVKP